MYRLQLPSCLHCRQLSLNSEFLAPEVLRFPLSFFEWSPLSVSCPKVSQDPLAQLQLCTGGLSGEPFWRFQHYSFIMRSQVILGQHAVTVPNHHPRVVPEALVQSVVTIFRSSRSTGAGPKNLHSNKQRTDLRHIGGQRVTCVLFRRFAHLPSNAIVCHSISYTYQGLDPPPPKSCCRRVDDFGVAPEGLGALSGDQSTRAFCGMLCVQGGTRKVEGKRTVSSPASVTPKPFGSRVFNGGGGMEHPKTGGGGWEKGSIERHHSCMEKTHGFVSVPVAPLWGPLRRQG